MKIGLFGGTFDPIHLGHVDMVRQVVAQMGLDRAIFIPAFIPPHKKVAGMTDYAHRLAMTRLAVREEGRFAVSTFESERETPSYTYHTLAHFTTAFPKDDFYYIMGADAFNDIETWYRWRDLLGMAHFIIVDRPDRVLSISEETAELLDRSPYEVYHLPLHTLPISSTMVRRRLMEQHASAEDYLDAAVWQYIKDNHLYAW